MPGLSNLKEFFFIFEHYEILNNALFPRNCQKKWVIVLMSFFSLFIEKMMKIKF
jgi:hypothetical protein